MEAEDLTWLEGEGGSGLLWCVVRPNCGSGLWGSVTVQVLRARAQPLPAKPRSLVKREVLPINIQPSCNKNTNC